MRSCHAVLSFCLDVKQIKGRGTVIIPAGLLTFYSCSVSVCAGPLWVSLPLWEPRILVTELSDLVGDSMGRSEWLSLMSRWAWLWCHRISARGITVICHGPFGIEYKGRALTGSSSLDTAPVTDSLLFNAPVCRLAVCCAAGFSSCVLFGSCDRGPGLASPLMSRWRFPGTLRRQSYTFIRMVWWIRTQFRTSWASLFRRPEAAVVRVLQGRDERSVRALVPDPRVLERGFHDVTIVDMGDLPEPSVSLDDLSLLLLQWPVTVSGIWCGSKMNWMLCAR